MKKLLSILLSGMLCLLVGIGCSPPAVSESSVATKTMRLASVNAKSRALSQGFYIFEELLEKETNGSIDVQVYTDGVLGDDRRTLEGLQIGSIQGTTVSTGPIASFAPSIGVFDLPFLFKDADTAYKILDSPIGQAQLDALGEYGFIGICYWENGWRHISNSKHEITTLHEIQGLKIRTLESPIHVDIWRALGANATPMSFSQLYTALEQKVVDGQENPLANVIANKFDEVQKYITLDGHIYGASPFLVSKVFWDTLTDTEKEAVKKCAIQARDEERKLAQAEDDVAIKQLTESGVIISQLEPGEKEKMREAVQSVYDKYGADFADSLKAIEEALK